MIARLLLLACLIPALSVRAADPFPTRPMTLVVGFAPGGVGDIVARTVAREASKKLGSPIIIDNRPVPTAAETMVAAAKPDGYTMVLTTNGSAVTQVLFKSLPFDVVRDFQHVTTLASFDLALVTGASSPFQDVADVVKYAKANPGKLNIATIRIGSTQNLGAELFKSAAGIDALVVPYKSTADVIVALRSGDAALAVEIVPPIMGQLQSKAIRPLAVMSTQRFAGLPQVPTMIESGYPGFEATSWNGISVPAGTPQAIVDKLAKAFQDAVATVEVQKELQAIGVLPQASTPAQMTQRVKTDIVKWRGVIEKAGIPRL